MKVKISYTVDLEQVPDLIKNLIKDSKAELQSVLDKVEQLSGEKLDVDSYRKIVEMSDAVSSLKHSYDDCYSLLGSYLKTVADTSIPGDQAPEEVHADRLEQGLRDSLEELKGVAESLSTEGGSVSND